MYRYLNSPSLILGSIESGDPAGKPLKPVEIILLFLTRQQPCY